MQHDAAVLWCTRQCSLVLPATAEQPSPGARALFDLPALQSRATILISEDGCQHVLLRDDGRELQLVITGGDILQPVRLGVDAVWPDGLLKSRLWALDCLNSLCAHGMLPERLFPPDKRRRRLCFVLRALDGSLAHASHRDIARELIGDRRVELDWGDPGNHLQDRIRRAIRRGRSLMKDGYLALLS